MRRALGRCPRRARLSLAVVAAGCAVISSASATRPADQPAAHPAAGAVSSTALSNTALSNTALSNTALSNTALSNTAVTSIVVAGHGNGHGHGLSQYGARGAAIAGLSSRQILDFYYPGTTSVTLAPSNIRVALSGTGSYTTIAAGPTGLTVEGIALPVGPTIARYRLVPSGTGLAVQRLGSASGATWTTYRSGLPATAYFASPRNYIRVFVSGGSTSYRGKVGAIRTGSGLVTVNRTTLDEYVMGVVPREMPASWQAAAVHAQAVAARSYARNAVESSTRLSWDICDTTQCQVYGGMRHYDSAGNLLWSDAPEVITGTANVVRRYGGATIFAQFSASSGGWTADGGTPYLTAHRDQYDNTASGDPYLNWTRTVTLSNVAAAYGLARITSIRVTARDGNGDWGGRVTAGVVNGVTGSGAMRSINVTGNSLRSAMGLPTEWFLITTPFYTVPAAPTGVSVVAGDAGGWVSWTPPANDGGKPITGYTLTFGMYRIAAGPATTRAWVGPRINGLPTTVYVRAVNAVGSSAPATATFTAVASPQPVVPLPAARLFDTRLTRTLVDRAHPYRFTVPGHAGVPAGATAVQLALTILHPSASATIRVHTRGTAPTTTAAIAYPAGQMTTTMLTVPLRSTSTVEFEVSAGSVELLADVMGYSGPGGQFIDVVNPVVLATIGAVPTGNGAAVNVRSAAGPSATAVLVRVNGSAPSTPGWLRVWSGGPAPAVNQIAVARYSPNTNTVLVPIGPTGTIRIAASGAGIAAQVSLIGVVGPAAAGRGALETYQVNGVADSRAGTSSLSVASVPKTLRVVGVSQMPATGVQAVVLHLTVSAPSSIGSLFVYATGTARPASKVAGFGASRTTTSTVIVPVGADGTITFQTSGPTVTVAVDSIGYVTS